MGIQVLGSFWKRIIKYRGQLQICYKTFIQKVTSCKLPVVISQTPRKGDILIGGQSPAEVTEDGFSISTKMVFIKISGKETVLYMGCYLLGNIWVWYWERMNILLPLQKRWTYPSLIKSKTRAFVIVRHNVMLSIQTLFISGGIV